MQCASILASRSRPAIGHGVGNAMEIMDVDGEDLGVVTSRLGHHSDQSSEDELLLKGRSSEDNGNGSRALPRASTSKLPPDGAYTQRLQQKVGGLGHSREQAIPITDNSIDEITEFSDDNGYGIAKGIVERGKAIFDQPKILSQSTLTKKIDFNAMSRTIGGVKARMKGKNQPTQVRNTLQVLPSIKLLTVKLRNESNSLLSLRRPRASRRVIRPWDQLSQTRSLNK